MHTPADGAFYSAVHLQPNDVFGAVVKQLNMRGYPFVMWCCYLCRAIRMLIVFYVVMNALGIVTFF
jgi:hypothetical protein